MVCVLVVLAVVLDVGLVCGGERCSLMPKRNAVIPGPRRMREAVAYLA